MTFMPTAVHLFRVGDIVKLKLGAREVLATVVEDRGFFGHGGEQVVRVSIPLDEPYEREFEVSASLIQPTRMAAG